MASPGAENLQNGISTPPTTANAPNPSPPTASSTQANTQQASQMNGTFSSSTTVVAPANPAFPPTSLQDTGTTKRPRDARLIHLILANMGVHAYTERVPLQLLDFAYRYTNGILSDALAYEPPAPHHTGKKGKAANAAEGGDDGGISLNALRTAIAARAANQFSTVLPKEFMTDVAMERNRVALPRVEKEWGIRLPPERYCFTGVGWSIKERWEEESSSDEMDPGAGGPVGGAGSLGGLPTGDAVMGGMEEDEDDNDAYEDAMGPDAGEGGDANMTNG
ncbi:TFIID-31kDa-domain-containing protein [Massarina eburnea CBS 473.64]|uniref:TFIID-31kDa-domain-containing protein n=1 Tax=Massarina eburnea CBS 473.64 TaxID=1395130 RepID=A0A6A6RVJ6_9PLEO|nr:TFIID-31kDa-domain-containing protein [Massarina eburnea CBS 473.64]